MFCSETSERLNKQIEELQGQKDTLTGESDGLKTKVEQVEIINAELSAHLEESQNQKVGLEDTLHQLEVRVPVVLFAAHNAAGGPHIA